MSSYTLIDAELWASYRLMYHSCLQVVPTIEGGDDWLTELRAALDRIIKYEDAHKDGSWWKPTYRKVEG